MLETRERSPLRPSRPRCAYCHDDLVGTGEAEPCDGCGALVHDECLAAGAGCPTLGCDFAAEPAEERPDPKSEKVAQEPDEPAPPTRDDLSALGLLSRVRRADRAPATWLLVLVLAGLLGWALLLAWSPQRLFLDARAALGGR